MSWFEILAAVVAAAIGLWIVTAITGAVIGYLTYRRIANEFAEREASSTYGDRLRRTYGLRHES